MNKITVVVTGRNDNYDGNFDDRLVIALSRNIRALPRAEFIFVEWNPLPNRPLTSENIRKIFRDRVKYYVVSPKYHSKYCTIDGFLEYPAKNVGIRKAKGDFILCTNSDVVLSPEVADAMRRGKLEKDCVYRATRVDIPMNYIDVEFPLKPENKLEVNEGLFNACGDFLLMHRDSWVQCTGYCEEFPEQRIHKDSFLTHLLVTDRKMSWKDLGIVTHWRHPTSWSSLSVNRPRVGDVSWDFTKSGFEFNKETWGLSFAIEENRSGIIWLV